jgi:hypothetical protein
MNRLLSSTITRAVSRAARRARMLFAFGAVAVVATACEVHSPSDPGTLASIVVTPNPTLISGASQQMTAVGYDASGRVVTITPTWSVATAAGTISTSGLYTAGATAGVYTNAIIATVGAITATATATVTVGPLASIILTPNPVTLAISGTQQFTAVGKDAGGNTVAITPTWSVVASGGTIDGNGLFTAGTTPGTFTNTVRVASGAIAATATVTVTSGPLATITVTPNPASLAAGATQTFTAVGKDAGGNTIATTVVWSIAAGGGTITQAGVFTAGNTPGTYTNTITATSGTRVGTATVTVTAGTLATLTVSPNPATLSANGTQQFTAVGRDANNNIVTVTPTWSVTNGGGAINTATGLFTAGAVSGTFTNTVTATSGTITATATVIVAGPLTSISVAPNPATLLPGGTQQFTAIGRDAANNVVAITPTWTVTNGGGTISTGGLFTAGTTAGTYANTVTATSGTASGSATVIIGTLGTITSITVTPNPAAMQANGTQQFTAVARDAGNNVIAFTPTWSVANGGGTISSTGLFTAGATTGTFTNTVTATNGTVTGSATVVVGTVGSVATLTITPNPAALLANGQQQFTAVARDAGGNIIQVTPTWTVTNGGGTINSTGLFTAGSTAGTFTNTVVATSGAVTGSATVVIGAASTTPTSITVTPNPATLLANGTQQFTAVGRDANNNVVVITPTWTVTNGGGTISSTGLFTAGATTGTFTNTVTATSGTASGSATVIVGTAGTVATITVTPNPATLLAGGTQQFTAVARDAANNIVTITPVWTVANGGGTISSSGLFTAGTVAGTYNNTVVATSGTKSGSATVVVGTVGPLTSITVTPNPAAMLANGTQQFTAVGRDANNNIVTITPVWTVGNGGGTINATGLFTAGAATGTFANTVVATSGAITGRATVVVGTVGALATIVVTPNPAFTPTNGTVQFTAVGRDAGNNIVAITPTWSIANGGGTINGTTGLFTAGTTVATFANTVVATSGTTTGSATVTVTASANIAAARTARP